MSKLTPLQTKVAGQILESIACGDFPPGSHIKEIELAQHFGVSRSPIRGALFYLAGQQILTAEKHCGFTVATACSEALQNTLAGLRVAEDDLYRLIIDDHLNQTLPGHINESDLLRRYQCSKSILRRCLQRLTERRNYTAKTWSWLGDDADAGKRRAAAGKLPVSYATGTGSPDGTRILCGSRAAPAMP